MKVIRGFLNITGWVAIATLLISIMCLDSETYLFYYTTVASIVYLGIVFLVDFIMYTHKGGI